MHVEYPWERSYPPHIDWHQTFEPKPLYSLIDEGAEAFGSRAAIDFMGHQISFKGLKDQVDRMARSFQKLGVQPGTKVGLFLPNCPQFVVSYFAILKAGGTVVNFSPLYSFEELKHQVIDSDVEIMVTLNLDVLYPKIEPLVGVGSLRHVVVSTIVEVLPWPKNVLYALFKRKELAQVRGGNDHSSFMNMLDSKPIEKLPECDPKNDIAVIQYTGGTTGVPKGAKLSHHNVLTNAVQSAQWCSVDAPGQGVLLAVLPFFHVFAMTTCMNMGLYKGSTIVMLPRFDLKQVLKTIHKYRPTAMPGVPAMYNAIAYSSMAKRYNLKSLKACVSGGAPLPVEVKKDFEKATGCTLIEGYGLTEASPVVCANPLEGKNKTGTIGLPMPGTVVEIESLDEPGVMLGVEEEGELCVRGPQVMVGYFKSDDAGVEILENGEARLHTGDVAVLDDEGYVRIVDRKKELIISNGFNIYPRAVEEAIYEHDDVMEVAVIGIADKRRGEAVKAFVVLKPGKKLTGDALLAFLKDRLGKYKIPRIIEFRDELPKTMVGKIDKKKLKEH